MENAKQYLKRLGVKVTADSSEWTHATNYRTVRKKIMHAGGRLGQSDGIVGFAGENWILVDTPLLGEDRELSLCMTREFFPKSPERHGDGVISGRQHLLSVAPRQRAIYNRVDGFPCR